MFAGIFWTKNNIFHTFVSVLMHTILETPIQSLDIAALQAMQAKYPNAVVRVETADELQSGQMDEGHFWAVIAF